MTTAEKMAVMQAYLDGKQIQYNSGQRWVDVEREPKWHWGLNYYRIAPEQNVRPYTFEELVEAIKVHGVTVKYKETTTLTTIIFANTSGVNFYSHSETYYRFLDTYVWLDGTPCGVVEE